MRDFDDFQIKITNGVIEEIKWVSEEMYEPYFWKVKKGYFNEYFLEHGWKHITKKSPGGFHINPHTGKSVDCNGQHVG